MFRKIEISLRTVLATLAILAGLWLVVEIKDILFLVFIAFLLMTAIYPLVVVLEKIKIPRLLAILIVYVLLFVLFGIFIVSSIPSLISQTTRLVQTLPALVTKVLPYWNINLNTVVQQLAPFGENLVNFTVGLFSNIVTTFMVLVFAFYFLLERGHSKKIIADTFGESIAQRAMTILRVIETRLGAWVRGELILMVTSALFIYIGLIILHVDFALPIAIVTGLLEIIPNIGPIIAAIPAILIGLSVSPLLALSVVILYIVMQTIEGNVIVPIVMKKSVGLSPIVSILALLIGGKLAGITGAVLGVPVLLVCQVLVNAFVYPGIS
jgi:predicted PurR-regulated permease PerM